MMISQTVGERILQRNQTRRVDRRAGAGDLIAARAEASRPFEDGPD